MLCALTASSLVLTGCGTDDTAADQPVPALARVSITPQDTLDVAGAGHARSLEMTDSSTLRMTTSEHAATATSMRVNTDSGRVDQQRNVIVPGAEDDPTFHMFDFDDAKIAETAQRAADLAEAKFTSEQGTKPAEHTNELSRNMYETSFLLDVLRARTGYGATQRYDEAGKRNPQAMLQLGAGDTIGMLDATGEHAEHTDADTALPLQGGFPTIERSVGMCALDAPNTENTDTSSATTLDGNDVTVRGDVLISSSGSSALVPRDASSFEELSVIQATLPHALDDDQRAPERGERFTLMGLSELDCVTTPAAGGDETHNSLIFAAVDTDLAERTDAYQRATNALRDYLDEQEQDAVGDETPARPREEAATTTQIVPDEKGLVAVMTADGTVQALLDSEALTEAHPEIRDKNISAIAVDPASVDATRTIHSVQGQRGWFSRLTAPLRDTPAPETQTVTLWLTYEGIDTIYRTQAELAI